VTDLVIVQHGSWPGWDNADIPLSPDCAAAYLTGLAAYRADHPNRTADDTQIAEPVGGNRTPDQVRAMQSAFDSRDPAQMRYWNLDPSSKARPGLSSPHIGGNCVDIWASDFQWWIDNGPRFGLRRTLVASGDAHHFQFFPGTATADLHVQSLDNLTEDDMATPIRILVDAQTDSPEYQFTYLHDGGNLTLLAPGDKLALSAAIELVKSANNGIDPGYYPVTGQQMLFIKALCKYGATPAAAVIDQVALASAIVEALKSAQLNTEDDVAAEVTKAVTAAFAANNAAIAAALGGVKS
jgi:hypothetical protein